MRFVLAIQGEDGKFGVTVPDLPGCFSAGDTLEEAIDGAHEAIDGHVELLIEGGNGLPEFRTLDQHLANKYFAGALWAVIEVPVERYFGPAEKINITVPALTLKRIDAHAKPSRRITVRCVARENSPIVNEAGIGESVHSPPTGESTLASLLTLP